VAKDVSKQQQQQQLALAKSKAKESAKDAEKAAASTSAGEQGNSTAAAKPVEPNYGGLVHSHNPGIASKFVVGEYPKMLEAAVKELRGELEKLEEPEWD